MSEAGDSKVCPYCAETIKAAASVCPHCRYTQKRLSLRNPHVLHAVILAVYMVVMIGMIVLIAREFGPRESFATYHDYVAVVSSQFSTRTSGSNTYVFVFGTLTNLSNIGWRDVAVEAQLLDRSGRLIDTIVARTGDFDGPVVLPHGQATFKVEGRAAQAVSEYDSCRAYVHWAKDADSWP
jgi:hypothetical protein